MKPLVSIVTPTIPGREELLWRRCVPSVEYQNWSGDIEHIVVSDRNEKIHEQIFWGYGPQEIRRTVKVVQINESWRSSAACAAISAIPWYVGSLIALGEFVGFLGDDDELLPDHCERHISAMLEHEADFSVSQVEFRVGGVPQFLVGNDSFAHGHLDADGVMCRSSALAVANWSVGAPGDHEAAPDFRLVRDWRQAGLKGVFVGEGPTAIHHDGWVVGRTGKP